MRFSGSAKKLYIGSSIVLCLLPLLTVAQQNKKEGSIQNEDIVIDKERKIELQPQVSRSFDALNEIENQKKGRKMKYDFVERRWEGLNLPTLTNTILSPRDGDELTSAYGSKFQNVVKVGVGNYGHTLLNAHFGFNPSENQFRGIYVSHDANRKGPNLSTNSARNDNEIKLYSKTFTNNYLLNGSIDYKRSSASFYGRKDFVNIPNDDFLNINYDKFNYNGSISNAKKDAKIDYIAKSGLTFITSNKLDKEWVWESKIQTVMKLNENLFAYFNGDMTLSEYTSLGNNRRQLYRVKPSFLFKNNRVSVHAGINVVNEKDRIEGENQTSLFPVVKVDFKPTDFLHIFAGLGGDTYFNTYDATIRQNPWLARNIQLKNTQQTANIFGGFKGTNERNIDFEVKVDYSEFSNLNFFTNTLADSSKFELIYTGGQKKVQVLNVSGQFNYQINERFLSVFKFDYNSYSNLGELEKPFGRPMLNVSFTNSITFKDKIIISPDVYYMNGLYGWNAIERKSIKLDDILDLNLKVNYLVTKKFNAYVSTNNLLGKNYQRYLNYQTLGLNYTVGLAYSF
jgi:hypothetical protein